MARPSLGLDQAIGRSEGLPGAGEDLVSLFQAHWSHRGLAMGQESIQPTRLGTRETTVRPYCGTLGKTPNPF